MQSVIYRNQISIVTVQFVCWGKYWYKINGCNSEKTATSIICHLQELAVGIPMALSFDGERELVVAAICTDCCVCV